MISSLSQHQTSIYQSPLSACIAVKLKSINQILLFLSFFGYKQALGEIVEESKSLGQIYARDVHEDDLDDIDSIFSGKKSLIRSEEC